MSIVLARNDRVVNIKTILRILFLQYLQAPAAIWKTFILLWTMFTYSYNTIFKRRLFDIKKNYEQMFIILINILDSLLFFKIHITNDMILFRFLIFFVVHHSLVVNLVSCSICIEVHDLVINC